MKANQMRKVGDNAKKAIIAHFVRTAKMCNLKKAVKTLPKTNPRKPYFLLHKNSTFLAKKIAHSTKIAHCTHPNAGNFYRVRLSAIAQNVLYAKIGDVLTKKEVIDV